MSDDLQKTLDVLRALRQWWLDEMAEMRVASPSVARAMDTAHMHTLNALDTVEDLLTVKEITTWLKEIASQQDV